jgi:hypothetical protein
MSAPQPCRWPGFYSATLACFCSAVDTGKLFLLFNKAGFSTHLNDFAKDETRRVHLLTPEDIVRANR